MKKIFLAAAWLVSTAAFAQKVSNKIQFPQGKKVEMTVDVTSTTDLGMGMLTSKATIDRIFDINSVNGGNAAIEHKIKRIVSSMSLPGMGDQTFDSEKEGDLKSPMGKALEKLMKNKYAMTVDGAGKVVSVKLDDDNAAARASNPQDEMILGMLSDVIDGLEAPKEGDRTIFRILPDREVGKGETWSDSVQNRKTMYTIADITDTEIIVTYTETGKTIKEQNLGPATLKTNLDDTTEGRIVLDRKTGLLKQKTASTSSNGTLEAMGQQGPVTSKMTRTWTVK